MKSEYNNKLYKALGRLGPNVIILLVTCILLATALEAAFRIKAWLSYRASFDVVVRQGYQGGSQKEQNLRAAAHVGLGFIIRVSEHKEMIYELIPNMTAFFEKSKIKTNAAGFRDREYPMTKPPATVRIVGIGDSFMFGNGVWQNNDYLAQLEALLNERRPEVRWEVINTGIPGYNTVQELGMLRHNGLRFEPDLVLLGFYENDFCLPNFLVAHENYFTHEKSFFLSFLSERIGVLKGRFQPAGKRADLVRQALGVCDPKRAPEPYAFMVGKEAVHGALRELKQLSTTHDFQTLFVTIHPYPSEQSLAVGNFAQKLGMQAFNVGSIIENYMDANGFKEYLKSPLVIKSGDPHPSKLGHRLVAEELLRRLEDSGTLQELIGKAKAENH